MHKYSLLRTYIHTCMHATPQVHMPMEEQHLVEEVVDGRTDGGVSDDSDGRRPTDPGKANRSEAYLRYKRTVIVTNHCRH